MLLSPSLLAGSSCIFCLSLASRSFPSLPPCATPRKSFVLFLLHHYYHRVAVESNPICHLCSFSPRLLPVHSLTLSLFLLLSECVRAHIYCRALSLSFSRFRAGLGAANYPGHRYFLPRIKTDNRIITKIKVLNFVTFPLIKEVTIKQTCQSSIARINEACGWISVSRKRFVDSAGRSEK